MGWVTGDTVIEAAKHQAPRRVAPSQGHAGVPGAVGFETVEPQGVESDEHNPDAGFSFIQTGSTPADQHAEN